ncbi:MAG: PepSY domain-containing protein [Neisseriaceae bacterium]|nr:PepSY domain-containing protein [Neisseriaceae bacterium]
MKKIVTALSVCLLAGPVWAGYSCEKHAPNERLPMSKVLAQLEKKHEVYEIKLDDNCYQAKVQSANGKRSKLYLDTRSGSVVHEKTKSDKKDKRDKKSKKFKDSNDFKTQPIKKFE